MFIKADTTRDRLNVYRDVLAVYKKIIESGLSAYGIPVDAVTIKNTVEQNKNRAPLIIISRSDMQHIPRSLLLSEQTGYNVSNQAFESTTTHMIEYPIEFKCFGNSYLEAEKLGGLAMEAILTTGMSIVKTMHPNIIGAELVWWGKSDLAEGTDSTLAVGTVVGKVFMNIDGYYSISN
jgi:hypothetical protein